MAEQTTDETIEEKMTRLRDEANTLKDELEKEQKRKMQLIELYNDQNKKASFLWILYPLHNLQDELARES